jgi:hypothetical protein
VRGVLLQSSGSQNAQYCGSLDSGFGKALARNGWYLLVSISISSLSFRFRVLCVLKPLCPGGNSLLLSTMIGGLFGAVFHTGTLYGSVTIGASPESRVDLLIQ